MKVLVINTIEFSRLNGITSVIMNYYKHMDKQNMKIDFLVLNNIEAEYQQEFEKNHSKVFVLDRRKKPIEYCIKLRKILRQQQYDLVHIHGNSAMMLPDTLISKIEKIPVRIVHCHNTTCSHLFLHNLFYPVFKKVYTHAFACGQDAGKWLYRDNPFVEMKNGIDLEKYCYDEKKREIYRKKIKAGNKTVIGHVGKFIDQKNHEFLIEVFAKLIEKNKNYLLLLISEGYLMNQIKKKVHELGLDEYVIFVGKTSNTHAYLQAMDLFVLPSLFEGLPISLVEAQAEGLYCLVADTITREADLTDGIEYLSIQDTNVWVREIEKKTRSLLEEDRKIKSEKWQNKIKQSGYDIVENTEKMKELYNCYYEKNVQGR